MVKMSMVLKTPILNQVFQETTLSQKKNEEINVIFDIDSTLLSVSPRSQAILDFILKDKNLEMAYPNEVKLAKLIKIFPQDWGLRTAFERNNINGAKDFFEHIRKAWHNHFFGSDFLKYDIPYLGAKEFVSALADQGAQIYYLTGRDRPRMGVGTLSYLKDHKWPLAHEDRLIMKPNSQRHDEEFKLQILSQLPVNIDKCWFFENEPVIIDLIQNKLKALKIVFVDSVHSGRAQAPIHLPSFSAFDGYI